jgi:hypothetical protein
MTLHSKAIAGPARATEAGEVTAIVATVGVVDHDGDVILSGAVAPGAPAVLSMFGHDALREHAPPVGRGTLTEQAGRLVFVGQYFMDTTRGVEAFRVVRGLAELAQWSFGYRVTDEAQPSDEQRRRGALRLIRSMDVSEVSPVLRGAGIGTGTETAKRYAREQAEIRREAARFVAASRRGLAVLNGSFAAEQIEMRRIEEQAALRRIVRQLHRRRG